MRYELKKLFSRRFFLLFLLVLLLTNAILAYLQAPKDKDFRTLLNTFFEAYEKEPDLYHREYLAYLEAKELAVDLQIQAVINGEDPEKYAFNEPMTLYPESGVTDGELYTALYSRLEYPRSYRLRIEEILQNTEKNLAVVTDPYMRSYLNGVLETYRTMAYLPVSDGYVSGWDSYFRYHGTGILLLAAVFMVALFLAVADREGDTESILYATKKGFCGVLGSKISALAVFCVFTSLAMEAVALAAFSVRTPFHGFAEFLASFEDYALCPHPLYVFEFFFLRLGLRILTLFSLGTLFLLMARMLNNRFLFLAAGIGFIGLHAMWNGGDVASLGSLTANLNLFRLLEGDNLVTRYVSVNLFGISVPLPLAYCVAVMGTAALSILLLFLLPRRLTFGKRKPFKWKLPAYIPRTALGFEAKKLFFSAGLLFPILLILLSKSLVPAPPLTYKDEIYRSYMTVLEGELTPEKERFLDEESTRFRALFEKEKEYTLLYEAGKISFKELSALRMEVRTAEIRYGVFTSILEEVTRIKALNEKDIPAVLLYPKGWESLFAPKIDLFLLLILLFPAFAYVSEDRQGYRVVMYASPKGRSHTLWAKIILSAATTVTGSLLLLAMDVCKLHSLHTLPLAAAPLASLPSGGIETLSLAGCLAVAVMIRILLCAVLSATAVFLAYKFRHPILFPLLWTVTLFLPLLITAL